MRGEPLKAPSLLFAAFALLGAHAISALFSVQPHVSVSIVMDWALEGVLLAALIINVFRTRADVIAAVNAVLGAGVVMGLAVIIQQLTGATDHSFYGLGQLDAQLVGDDGQVQRRLAGAIGETNRFAQVMGVLLPLSAALAVTSSGLKSLGYWLATALIGGGMALAFSRGVIVALALTVPFALLFGIMKIRHVLLGLFAAFLLLLALPHYAERVISIGQVAVQTLGLSPGGMRNTDGATRGRLTEMKSSALIFLDHPLIGAGPGMAEALYPEYAPMVGGKVRPGTRRSHNLYLELAAETGLIGLVAFALVILFAFSGLENARKRLGGRDPTLWAIVCGLELALIIWLTTSLFLHAAYVRYFWLLLGMCVAASSVADTPVLIRLLGRLLAQSISRVQTQT